MRHNSGGDSWVQYLLKQHNIYYKDPQNVTDLELYKIYRNIRISLGTLKNMFIQTSRNEKNLIKFFFFLL